MGSPVALFNEGQGALTQGHLSAANRLKKVVTTYTSR